ncbi:MAG TPA: hypothetical protein VF657_15540 [Actinoplanes sp.]
MRDIAPEHDAAAGADRRRLHRSAALHGVAVVIFGLMAWRGAGTLGVGAEALGVPMLIAGTAGASGALVIVWSVLRHRHRTAHPGPPARTGAQLVARIGMGLAAVATVAAGVVLAPAGWEREFVISVNTVTGSLLGVFALLAGERRAR